LLTLSPNDEGEAARATDQGIGNTRGIEADLGKELNAWISAIKAAANCRSGCKDFEVFCNVADEVSRADKANGIADIRFVGVQWLQFDQRWYDRRDLGRFTKTNGTWKLDRAGMWDIGYVCRRR
jgi:hypothetical protein